MKGDVVSGVIQQGRNPDDVMVDLGKLEALLTLAALRAAGAQRATEFASKAEPEC